MFSEIIFKFLNIDDDEVLKFTNVGDLFPSSEVGIQPWLTKRLTGRECLVKALSSFSFCAIEL